MEKSRKFPVPISASVYWEKHCNFRWEQHIVDIKILSEIHSNDNYTLNVNDQIILPKASWSTDCGWAWSVWFCSVRQTNNPGAIQVQLKLVVRLLITIKTKMLNQWTKSVNKSIEKLQCSQLTGNQLFNSAGRLGKLSDITEQTRFLHVLITYGLPDFEWRCWQPRGLKLAN